MSTKLPLDSNYDLEQQFILRMTDPVAAENLAADIAAGVSFRVRCVYSLIPFLSFVTNKLRSYHVALALRLT